MQEAPIFNFKLVTETDLSLLFTWFQQPYISQLWKEPTDWAIFREKYVRRMSEQEFFPFLAYIDKKPIAYIKYHHVNDEDRAVFPDVTIPEGSMGIDLFIGDSDYLNKGYGVRLLTEFIEFVKKLEPSCTTIMIDPAVDNLRAIKCYQKVGFKIIGEYITPYGPTGEGPGPILLMLYALPVA